MVDASNTELDHFVRGQGPGLLLAHGAGSDIRDSFGPLIEPLAEEHTVVAPDFPGSGNTPRARTPLTADGLADALVRGADRAGLSSFAVLGFSTGSPVAVRIATRYPDRVRALVLSAGFAYPNPQLRLAVRIWRELGRSADQRTLASYLAMMVFGRSWLDERSDGEVEELVAEIAENLPPGMDDHLDLLERVDVRADLAEITAPTLVISAAEDKLISAANARELLTGITGSQGVELPCGHAIAAESPAEWATAITSFLR
ncbi:alpha/beta hydrolase [Saccharopolyspora sp. NPDC050389]|uniref:alpha/beta fold hydrolase n=1 Tax=Saccharopolyspora sp. NPDC050389 TaxID=3155516 RepID=UPI0033FAADA0